MKENRKKSVFFKIFLVMMAFFVSVNLTMILYSFFLVKNFRDRMNQENENAMRLYVNHLDNTLEQLENELYAIHGTYNAKQLCISNSQESLEWNVAQNSLIMDYKETLEFYPDLSAVFSYYDYGENSHFVIRSLKPAEQWNNLIWRDRISNYVQSQISEHKYVGMNWSAEELNDTMYLVFLRKRGGCYYGAVINLETLLENWGTGKNSGYSTYFEGAEKSFKIQQTESKKRTVKLKVVSEHADLAMVQEISLGEMYAQIPGFIKILLIMSVISMTAIPVIYLLIQKYIRKPTDLLLEGIRQVEEGNLNYQIPNDGVKGEFEKVNHNFNSMVSQISSLKIAAYETQLEKQRIQMQYLTKQIQPHFILNTLNILYSYEPEEYPLIQKMILCLAKYFRYIVKVDQDFVPLYQELEHIRNYFKIQEARYPENFYYYVEMEEGMDEAPIPPLLIQNFAENSIKYALRMGQKIKIYVLVENVQGNKMRIRIADTGDGMPQEALDAIIRFQHEKKYQKELGIGIQNAIERLELMYHSDATIKIYNSTAGGATVDITMPITTEQ